ncbi:MAG TPA: hypothetical protein VMS75_04875 [Terriglobales bacterium]|nr:hypothetical protein [Terriglobales bacterium]
MMKKPLAGFAVLFVLSAALAHAGDQDKDKSKTNPPSKPAAVGHAKPAAAPSRSMASATPHGQAPAVRPKPSVAAERQRVVTHQQTVVHAAPARGSGPAHPVVRQVNVVDLHRRMNAPVAREVLIRDRDRYHQAELVRFRVQPPRFRMVPRYRVVLINLRVVPRTYYHRRFVFYETYGFVPPVYIYGLRPSYGLWCATFLAFMLDRIALAHQYEYSLMYYDHMNEPEFVQWRQEMNGLAAENAELRQKLAALDARVSELEGTQRNAAYVPDEAGDVALSPQAVDQMSSGPGK